MSEYRKVNGAGGRWSTTFSCDMALKNRIANFCAVRGCTKSWLISKALDTYLSEAEEDLRDAELAAAYERFEKSGSKGYTAEEARKLLGL